MAYNFSLYILFHDLFWDSVCRRCILCVFIFFFLPFFILTYEHPVPFFSTYQQKRMIIFFTVESLLSEINLLSLYGVISELPVLFHRSVHLFLWWYLTVLMSVTLRCIFKSSSVSPPTLFFSSALCWLIYVFYFSI